MRISTLIAKCEDKVIVTAPKVQGKARSATGKSLRWFGLTMQRIGARCEDTANTVLYPTAETPKQG